jgi:hypothetical protein
VGPVSFAENAGAIRSVDSDEEPGGCGEAGGSENAPENATRSDACSSVASGTTPTALLELIDAAITALDAGETHVARARLHALADAVAPRVTPGTYAAFGPTWDARGPIAFWVSRQRCVSSCGTSFATSFAISEKR